MMLAQMIFTGKGLIIMPDNMAPFTGIDWLIITAICWFMIGTVSLIVVDKISFRRIFASIFLGPIFFIWAVYKI